MVRRKGLLDPLDYFPDLDAVDRNGVATGGLAFNISAALVAASSDSNVSIDVPVVSSSLTH